MKKSFIYVVVDKVGKSLIQQFFAVSDEEARRKVKYSLDKEQIPSVMAGDLEIYRCDYVTFPECFDDVQNYEQLNFDFVKEN